MNERNLRFTPRGVRYCRACRSQQEKDRREKLFARRHDQHDIIATRDNRRFCRTCNRSEQHVDETVIERIVAGDRPAKVTAAEREAAVITLRLHRHPYTLIAQRAGCSPRHAIRICQQAGLTRTRQAPQ